MTEETITYAMSNLSGRGCVLRGMTDGLEALRQAVFLLLQTEAGRWPVYSGDYGVELAGLFGRPSAYVIPEAERRLREALLRDERILAVEDFKFKQQGSRLACRFVVKSIYGELALETEVLL